MSLSRKWC